MIRPTLEEIKKLSSGYTTIPICLEIFSDVKTPIEILRNIKRQSDSWYILESISGSDNWGRYSFLGYKPVMTISKTEDNIVEKNDVSEKIHNGDPVQILKNFISKYKSPRIEYLPPFTGGFVGYLSYDFVKHFIHGLELHSKNDEGFGDFSLMLMDKVIAFDHFKQKIYIIVNISTDDIDKNYIHGVTQLKDIEKNILEPAIYENEKPSVCGEFSPSFTQSDFTKMVNKVKDHILEGDIFQAVISNRFKAPFKGNLMNTYRILRTTNPSPYMVYMKTGDMEIACSSPETLVALRNGVVSSFPLAGTCPRGKDEQEDNELIEKLMNDKKELCEHDMLVDLARNDVGKVSEFGSVEVKEYRQIKQFSHVSHIASQITGKLADNFDALDVISAALPAGTLSGAPKKRACEIIDSVEGIKRGVYGGAIGYIDFAGNMDMCIGIRMAVLKDGNVFVQSGAGIVADSDAEKEYIESQNKAQVVIDALKNSKEV